MLVPRKNLSAFRSAFKAAGLAFDEKAVTITEPDSAFANKIIAALVGGGLEPGDIEKVVDMLADAGWIDSDEARAVKEDINPPAEMAAMDSAAYVDRVSRRRRRQFDRGVIGMDHLRAPITAPMSAASEKDFAERFPNAGRLKG